MLQLAAPDGPLNDFSVKLNLTDVGGAASDINFVRTDTGLRVAALVPSKATAVLIDPATSITTTIQLAEAFSDMSLVTSAVAGGTSTTDVALLWNGSSGRNSGVAFWALGKIAGEAFRSVEVLSLRRVSRRFETSGPYPELKILDKSAKTFYVLNLKDPNRVALADIGSGLVRRFRKWQALVELRTKYGALGGHRRGDPASHTAICVSPDSRGVRVGAIRRWARTRRCSRADGVGTTVLDALAPGYGEQPRIVRTLSRGALMMRIQKTALSLSLGAALACLPSMALAEKPLWHLDASLKAMHVANEGYEPFADRPLFSALSLGGARALIESDRSALSLGVRWQSGATRANVRDARANLFTERFVAPIQFDYFATKNFVPFVRFAPGVQWQRAEVSTTSDVSIEKAEHFSPGMRASEPRTTSPPKRKKGESGDGQGQPTSDTAGPHHGAHALARNIERRAKALRVDEPRHLVDARDIPAGRLGS